MIPLTGHYQLYLYTEAADMRKAFDGLSGLIVSVLGRDPLDGSFYIFLNKRRNRMKCLVWDQTGLILIYKKLEGGAFSWPKPADGVIRLSPAQFAALFEGVDWRAVRAERRQRPRLAG